MDAFPLERFTTDPNILKYSEPLRELYKKLLGEFGSARKIMDDLKEFIPEDDNWLLHKIQEWGFEEPEVLNGLFLKIYDANMSTLNWPPLNYPKTAPLLVHVPGYHGESEIEWSMRILRKIGLDMHLGYAPTEMPPPYTPDMSNPLNPFERSWTSDPTIREAFAAIHAVLLHPPPEHADRPVNNPRLVHRLLSGPSLYQNMGQPNRSRLPASDNEIFTAYTREYTIYEDTICSPMSVPARFYGRIRGSTDFDSFYAKIEKRSKEYDVHFLTNSILPEKLTRKDLPWDQQLFTIIGPSANPHKDRFHMLSRGYSGSSHVPISDTMWIQMTSEPMSGSSSSVCIIQGAYMSIFKPFLWLYFNGVKAVSPSLLQMLKGSESHQELNERKALQALIHPQGTLSARFTLFGKNNFNPLLSNLGRLRKTLKKPSWSPWSLLTKRGSDPSKLVNEFIERYDVDLKKTQEIRDAVTALKKHHTTANKDVLIQALKDAIRKYKGVNSQLPLDTYTGVHDKAIPNLGGTDYSAYNVGIKDLETEMAKPWYAKTWGKSKAIIKNLLETYLELFSDKGDLNIVNALLALKKLKSHDAIKMLKTAIDTRRYTVRGLPTPSVNSEGPVRIVPLAQTIRDERARLDPTHQPVERRGQQPWEGNLSTVRVIPELPLELPRADPVSVRRVPKRSVTAKAPKIKQQTEANVLKRIENVAAKTVEGTPRSLAMPRSLKMPPKPAFTNSNSDEVASIPSLTPESNLIKPNMSVPLSSGKNTVSVQLPSGKNTVSVPLGQAGGQANSQAGGFAPSLMSSFVANGMSLMPVASYLGYKQMKQKIGRKTRRR